LYNAVLQVSDFEIVERHPHVKKVHYVEENKDATVSYGSVDFKFKNNTGNDIKIYANSDLNSVNIRIIKIEEQ
jgi:vancomycin resistance protein YoaR